MLAYYLHNLSPDIVRFTDRIGLHWYGFAYVLGFYCAFLVMRSLSRRGYGQLKPEAIGDFITLVALFGVVLGGRLGYILFYKLDDYIAHPLNALKLWEGGMASHGGILGIVIFTWFYARKHKISWPGLGDNLVVGAPLGLLFGRIANFINGELYGRATDVSWAMKFPTELHEPSMNSPEINALFPDGNIPMHSNEIIAAVKQIPDGVQRLEAVLTPRHPSQLYEAAGEGLFLFLILYFVRTRSKDLPYGLLTGLFFILYAIARIVCEAYREPDSSLILGITKGQFYSTFMIGMGIAFILNGLWSKRRAVASP
jgi:phosphatidylglycerol:prolipoprotein diacylglycerol transferase